jgi:hypothetical protein
VSHSDFLGTTDGVFDGMMGVADRWDSIDVLGSFFGGIGVIEDGMEWDGMGWDGIRDRIQLELELDMG